MYSRTKAATPGFFSERPLQFNCRVFRDLIDVESGLALLPGGMSHVVELYWCQCLRSRGVSCWQMSSEERIEVGRNLVTEFVTGRVNM